MTEIQPKAEVSGGNLPLPTDWYKGNFDTTIRLVQIKKQKVPLQGGENHLVEIYPQSRFLQTARVELVVPMPLNQTSVELQLSSPWCTAAPVTSRPGYRTSVESPDRRDMK